YIEFESKVTALHGTKIAILRSDNGGEYISKEFEEHLRLQGTEHETSIPRSAQQNGVAEKFNLTLLDKVRCLLHHASMPTYMWAHAVRCAVYLYSRTPHRTIGKHSPISRWRA